MTIDGRPRTDQRDRLAEAEIRPEDTTVLTVPTGAANTGYAYHDWNEDGEPRCGAGDGDTEFIEVSIEEAQRRNKSPCQFCQRIRSD